MKDVGVFAQIFLIVIAGLIAGKLASMGMKQAGVTIV
jgi:hypothetical protein